MAALAKLFSKRVPCTNFSLNSYLVGRIAVIEDFVCSTQALTQQFQQSREKSWGERRRANLARAWQVKRRVKFFDPHLTEENKDFVKEVTNDKYPADGSPLKEPPWPRNEWTPKSMRTGVIARKIGIYPMWRKDGSRIVTTLLQVLDNHVIRYIPPEEYSQQKGGARFRGKYGCQVMGADAGHPGLFTRAYNGLFEEAGVMPKKRLTRFIVTPDAALQPGTPLTAMHFRVGDYVDCYGKTIDRGFQGVMKRWGMKGGPATHGTTKAHRRVGSIGSSGPARVWPGKKMPGHMGRERRISFGMKIWRINTKYNVIWVNGPAVPGGVNNYVYIMDTRIPPKKFKESPPFPTFFPCESDQPIPDEFYDKELHPFADPTILYENEPEIIVSTETTKKVAKTASKSKR